MNIRIFSLVLFLALSLLSLLSSVSCSEILDNSVESPSEEIENGNSEEETDHAPMKASSTASHNSGFDTFRTDTNYPIDAVYYNVSGWYEHDDQKWLSRVSVGNCSKNFHLLGLTNEESVEVDFTHPLKPEFSHLSRIPICSDTDLDDLLTDSDHCVSNTKVVMKMSWSKLCIHISYANSRFGFSRDCKTLQYTLNLDCDRFVRNLDHASFSGKTGDDIRLMKHHLPPSICKVHDVDIRPCSKNTATKLIHTYWVFSRGTLRFVRELNLSVRDEFKNIYSYQCDGDDCGQCEDGSCSGDDYYCTNFGECTGYNKCYCKIKEKPMRSVYYDYKGRNLRLEAWGSSVVKVTKDLPHDVEESCSECKATCSETGITISSPLNMIRFVEICVDIGCLKYETNSTKVNAVVPPEFLSQLNLVDVRVWLCKTNKFSHFSLNCSNVKKDFCKAITCDYCLEKALAHECQSVGTITFSLIVAVICITGVVYFVKCLTLMYKIASKFWNKKASSSVRFFKMSINKLRGRSSRSDNDDKNDSLTPLTEIYVPEFETVRDRVPHSRFKMPKTFTITSLLLLTNINFVDAFETNLVTDQLQKMDIFLKLLIIMQFTNLIFSLLHFLDNIYKMLKFTVTTLHKAWKISIRIRQALRRVRARNQSVISSVALLLCLVTLVDCCSKTTFLHTRSNLCTRDTKGNVGCRITDTARINLSPINQESCLLLEAEEKIVGSLHVKTKFIKLECKKEFLYFTPESSGKVFTTKRCPGMGECTGSKCDNFTEEVASNIWPTELERNKHWLSCEDSCGCWGCGCLSCSSSCLFSALLVTNPSKTVYEVFKCSSWDFRVGIEVEHTDDFNRSREISEFELKPGVPMIGSGFSISLMTVSLPILSSLEECFLRNVKSREISMNPCNGRGELITGSPGEIQCPTLSDAEVISSRCSAKDSLFSCHNTDTSKICSYLGLDIVNILDHKRLPRISGFVSLMSSGDTVQAEVKQSSLIELQVDLDSFKASFVSDEDKCDVEFISLSGCYSCLSGANLLLKVSSKSKNIIGYLECPGLGLNIPINIEPKIREEKLTILLQRSKVIDTCTVSCPGNKVVLTIEGELKQIPPPSFTPSRVEPTRIDESGSFDLGSLHLPKLFTNVLDQMKMAAILLMTIIILYCILKFIYVMKSIIKKRD